MLEAYLPKVLCGFVLHCRNICYLKERVAFGICPEHCLSMCLEIDSIFLSDLEAHGCAERVTDGNVDLGRGEWAGLGSLLSSFEGQVPEQRSKRKEQLSMLPSTGATRSPFLANSCYQLSSYEGGQSLYKGRQLNLYTWTNTRDRKLKEVVLGQ